jgi:hypothetical protein
MAAVPASSYNFRLWTKQEFSFARAITVRYCGPPVSLCYPLRSGTGSSSPQLLDMSKPPPRVPYWIQNRKELSIPVDDVEVKAYYRENPDAFEETMSEAMKQTATLRRSMRLMVKTPFDRPDPDHIPTNIAFVKFILGEKLQKNQSWPGSWVGFRALGTRHVATRVEDYALVVLPSFPGYTLPTEWPDMTLPQLLDDGIEQYEHEINSCVQTKLPKGLFVDEPGSMRWKPSSYLDPVRVRRMKDVYEPLYDLTYKSIPQRHGSAALVFRRHSNPGLSRFARSQSYKSAFGDKSTEASFEFMKAVTKSLQEKDWHAVEDNGLETWAIMLIANKTSLETWPSSEHAAAFFGILLLWESQVPNHWIWPELDHETWCYEYMCRFVGVHPEVAHEKGLGLIVKTEDPPCIGLMNRDHYDSLVEDELHGEGNTETSPSKATDWLTVEGFQERLSWNLLSLECYRSKAHNGAKDSLPGYHVKGVWYHTLGEDASIGADVVDSAYDYDAILV